MSKAKPSNSYPPLYPVQDKADGKRPRDLRLRGQDEKDLIQTFP